MVGPKRSGKGTIARVLTGMVGKANVCGPTLSSLGERFGLWPLIDKQVAIVSDARLGSGDQSVLVERLLSLSGEDDQTVDKKYQEPWHGRFDVRFLIMSNELPAIADASGAMASRYVILRMTESFFGREDVRLGERLLAELPGILNWSLDGLERLRRRGHFVMPKSSREALRQIEELSSPIGVFVREQCKVGKGLRVGVADIWERWKDWCVGQGIGRPGTKQRLGRDLHSVIHILETKRSKEGRFYSGVTLKKRQRQRLADPDDD